MTKKLGTIGLLALFALALAGCSLNNSVALNQSFDTSFTGTSKTLTVSPSTTATSITLSGTATVNSGDLFISVLDPSGIAYSKSIAGSTTSSSHTINETFPIQTGTWTLRATATGSTGSFSLTLKY